MIKFPVKPYWMSPKSCFLKHVYGNLFFSLVLRNIVLLVIREECNGVLSFHFNKLVEIDNGRRCCECQWKSLSCTSPLLQLVDVIVCFLNEFLNQYVSICSWRCQHWARTAAVLPVCILWFHYASTYNPGNADLFCVDIGILSESLERVINHTVLWTCKVNLCVGTCHFSKVECAGRRIHVNFTGTRFVLWVTIGRGRSMFLLAWGADCLHV